MQKKNMGKWLMGLGVLLFCGCGVSQTDYEYSNIRQETSADDKAQQRENFVNTTKLFIEEQSNTENGLELENPGDTESQKALENLSDTEVEQVNSENSDYIEYINSTENETNPENTETQETTEKTETDTWEVSMNLDDIFYDILNSCTAEFIGYHQVDESFLMWFYQEYGEDKIESIRQEVLAGGQNPEIWYTQTGKTIQVLWLDYCEASGLHSYQLEHVTWKECASTEETVFSFTGDINFSEGYVTTVHMDQQPGGILDCFSEDLLQVMNDADVMMINNEFTYSTRGTAIPGKAYTFRANPERVELLKVFGTDIVNVANNHVCDYGDEALLDTLSTLDEAGILHVGAGANIEEASIPEYYVCNGRKIAIVSATQIERTLNYTKEATETTPGVLKALDPTKYAKVIQQAKRNSDIVIASIHWGTEGNSNYGNDQTNLAKAFVKAGADAIIGGHTHCLQGAEIMDGVPVLYSLGNFWFSDLTQDTALGQVIISKDGELTLRVLPCIQENTKTSLITDPVEKERILTFLEKHSAGINFDEEGNLLDKP